MKKIEKVFGVRWIEVEFGQRDEGFALFTDLKECEEATKEASNKGCYSGGYIGPERPLRYIEIPFSSLETELKKKLRSKGKVHTENRWQPKYRSESRFIK